MLQFLFLIFVAVLAGGAFAFVAGWTGRLFAAAVVAFGLALTLPLLLPRLIGG
jgi:hypothetical protein